MNMLEGLSSAIGSVGEDVKTFVQEKPIGAAALGAVAIGGTALGVAAVVRKKRKKKKVAKKKKVKRKVKKKRKLKFGSPAWRKKYIKKKKRKISPKYARTAGKRKDTSTRRIRMTKHGQPYVILKSGKARFIKKSSARRSRKLKGGRY